MKNSHGISKKREASDSLFAKELDIAGEIAFNYGFTPIAPPKISEDDRTKAKLWKTVDARSGDSEERLCIMRLFQDMSFSRISQPPMLFMKKPFVSSAIKKKATLESCGLEILNVSKAAAEALIIKTAWSILSDCGCTSMHIEINSIGDKESFARFERELHSYFRKNIHNLTGEYRQKFRENNLDILSCLDKECELFRNDAPKSISSLTESSRIHFKEVLEFLESLELPYQINTGLLANKNYSSHTIFEIRGMVDKAGQEILLATGSRYNYLAKRAGYKKDIPAIGASVFYPKKAVIGKNSKKIMIHKMRPARFYLVQLGSLAKLQTLSIVEQLRREKIPVYHSLTKENIGAQLASAEYLKVSHLLIVGQKEAIENSVVVRSIDVRDQETVAMGDLSQYLKAILKKQ